MNKGMIMLLLLVALLMGPSAAQTILGAQQQAQQAQQAAARQNLNSLNFWAERHGDPWRFDAWSAGCVDLTDKMRISPSVSEGLEST